MVEKGSLQETGTDFYVLARTQGAPIHRAEEAGWEGGGDAELSCQAPLRQEGPHRSADRDEGRAETEVVGDPAEQHQ